METRKKGAGKPAERESFLVWISAENRIASFHPQEGMERKWFPAKKEFMAYLQELTESHYRFT